MELLRRLNIENILCQMISVIRCVITPICCLTKKKKLVYTRIIYWKKINSNVKVREIRYY